MAPIPVFHQFSVARAFIFESRQDKNQLVKKKTLSAKVSLNVHWARFIVLDCFQHNTSLEARKLLFVFTFSLYLRDKYTLQTDNKGQQYMVCLSEIFLTASQVMCIRLFLNSPIWRNSVNLPSTQTLVHLVLAKDKTSWTKCPPLHF